MSVELNPLALEALENNQRQLDMDGVEVGVSRQALDELITAYKALAAQPAREAQEPVAWRAVAHPKTGMGTMVNQIKHRLTEDADSLYGKGRWTLEELVPRATTPDAAATIERLRRQNDRLREKAQAVLANPGNDYARNALRAALTTEEG